MEIADNYFSSVADLCRDLDVKSVEDVVDILYDSYLEDRKIFIFGNGGSAATASHLCEDLAKGTIADLGQKKRLKAISLTDNTPYILALANDEGYETIFEQQMINMAARGDVALGISGSGKSENVLRAIRYANESDMTTIGFTGFDGGKLKPMVDCCLHIRSDNIGVVESLHLVACHYVIDRLRDMISGKGTG